LLVGDNNFVRIILNLLEKGGSETGGSKASSGRDTETSSGEASGGGDAETSSGAEAETSRGGIEGSGGGDAETGGSESGSDEGRSQAPVGVTVEGLSGGVGLLAGAPAHLRTGGLGGLGSLGELELGELEAGELEVLAALELEEVVDELRVLEEGRVLEERPQLVVVASLAELLKQFGEFLA